MEKKMVVGNECCGGFIYENGSGLVFSTEM
jgi:hypothetical protein